MSHVIMWCCLASAVAVVSLGVARLFAWRSAQQLRRLDADYRAFAMVEHAKREVAARAHSPFAYARDADGYLDIDALAPCDQHAFYGDEAYL
ncbi:hypothetical protein E4A48_06820 [Xanthomonas cerealis pv. cerealis]|uniref:Uncharacterized protein n=1 Tax=Xanthomonas cerealis pv. cerealis TaxID=152263 RepID=A0A514EBV2_9XANT|nr:hypothetical protein [Xanthomonas translucens]QDI03442.1 hypothetical protein E4A48_06820 [Xanthomonas translucens pv. cerealis]